MSSTMTVNPNTTETTKPAVLTDQAPPMRIGMENGYPMSPMYSLFLEYSKEEESEHSVSRRVALLATSPNLDVEDVEEVARGNESEGVQYRIKKLELSRIGRTITELQVFLERMAALIVERKKGQFFTVDPGNLIIRTLTRSQNMQQLQAGWLMLAQRMAAAQKFISKYITEYKDYERPTSPVSTTSGLHETIDAEPMIENRLKLAFAMLPRHAKRLSEDDRLTLRKYGSWDDTKVVPKWLNSLDENEDIDTGNRPLAPIVENESNTTSTRSRTSEETEEIYTSGVKNKSKGVSWLDSAGMPPVEPLLGGGTPFKSSKKFFDRTDRVPATPFPQRGVGLEIRSDATPNVLYGMGVPAARGAEAWTSLNSFPQYSNDTSKSRGWTPGQPIFEQGSSNKPSLNLPVYSQQPPPYPKSSYRNPTFIPGSKDNKGKGKEKPTMINKSGYRVEESEEGSHVSSPADKQDPQTPSFMGKESTSTPYLGHQGRGGAPPGDDYPEDDDYSEDDRDGFPLAGGPPGNNPPRRNGNHRGGNIPPGPRAPGGPGGNPPPPGGPGGNPPPPPGGPGGNQQPGVPIINGPQPPVVQYAYGNFIPTIKAELKQEQLPSWDGDHETAIEYFWKVQQLAALGGYIPYGLGYWLWHNLKEGSTIQLWFAMLPPGQQEYMRTHYLNYLKGIKDGFLGRVWQMKMNKQYENQSFRQPGHEHEAPTKFIVRRIMYTRMLVQSDNGGPLEVFLVMQRAPISWGPVINIDSITNTSELYAKVTEHERALVYSSRLESSHLVTTDNLAYTMRRLGLMVTPATNVQRRDNTQQNRSVRRANLGETNTSETAQGEVAATGEKDQTVNDKVTGIATLNLDSMFQEAFEVTHSKPRPPPKNGYPYPKNDHVTTKMGKPPPSPCKVCGSAKHWDKECPDWNVYLEGRRRSANLVIGDQEEDEADHKYQYAYSILLDERIASQWENQPDMPQDFHKAVKDVIEDLISSRTARHKSSGKLRESKASNKVSVTDEPDVEEELNRTHNPSESESIVEAMDYQKGAEPPPETGARTAFRASQKPQAEGEQQSRAETGACAEEMEGLESLSSRRIKIPKAKLSPPGRSSAGISVLSIKGRLIHNYNPELDLRLDSGADVTLVSEDYLNTLRMKPTILQGQKMRLWQLTDKNAEMKGYVRLPILIDAGGGKTLEIEAEAYVVPGMTVPILLGEDFQICYEIKVVRSAESGTTISFGGTPFSIKAVPVDKTLDFDKLEKSANLASKADSSRTHKRGKDKRQRVRKQDQKNTLTLRSDETIIIQPDTCKRIRVSNRTLEDTSYFFESNLIVDGEDRNLSIPNTLFNPTLPFLPVSNTSSRPVIVKKGDTLGKLHLAQSYFDKPNSQEDREKFSKHATMVNAFITARQRGSEPEQEQPETEDEPQVDELGPKSAELPDLTIYPSAQMMDLLDVGDLPDHLKDKAWVMLRKHVKAFGFDGRLGHYPSKVQIRTKEGQVPISLPMYGASPAKRAIIDEQLDKWFEQDVIKPSRSPWGAPVVIAYRNGKPRFCVDYRRLNANTTPDEFPLPRQSEILASLSGAQVLSSLDALSGFTQLEMDAEHKEKTAFRTHRGLFQFKRMPFGLRNGPSIFQRIMQGILSPYLWIFCLVYIDDIVVYSSSYEDHIDHLDKVLELIGKSGITLSPTKCHLFYGSILLLGHKVSRLGLSTHAEKVQAVLDLSRPSKLSELQTFLGMAVYFSAFIPYYADKCTPLFGLLRKGAKWLWEVEHEEAWISLKTSLQSSPVLGHPIEGLPYRLYTDASDKALGCALQQIQPIKLKDLKGMKAYSQVIKAHSKGNPPPKLTIALSSKTKDDKKEQSWAADLDESVIYVERVIGYWSRTFKSAETRYSTTEREALAAKEGLIKFQPYIEGEKILLVTDHSALQWARTYENANRRLAAWGAIFSAYAPGLEIIHRPGRVHSNVDPLSRIPRQAPSHISPKENGQSSIKIDSLEAPEDLRQVPAKRFSLCIWALSNDSMPHSAAYQLETRRQKRQREEKEQSGSVNPEQETPEQVEKVPEFSSQEKRKSTDKETDDDIEKPGNVHVKLDESLLSEWIEGYKISPSFKAIWSDERSKTFSLQSGYRYFKDGNELLFFRDAEDQPRLCVPENFRERLMELAHESAVESAHCGSEKLWQWLSPRFYWKRMKKDLIRFCNTCDTCQKTKPSTFNKYGFLKSNSIPGNPYESISMDFIVNLPMSGEFNAIFVIVDRLTKHANFIPTSTGLSADDFAHLFVKWVICRFGIPESVICDRDPRWTSDFWKAVAKELRSKMLFSSSHHPQTDGQTEIVNKQLEKMLRAYVNGDKSDWPAWLHLLEFAYNSTVHTSTQATPFNLLLGFTPRTLSDFLPKPTAGSTEPKLKHSTKEFATQLAMHRDLARQAIAEAQHSQAMQYNKRRKEVPTIQNGDKVLINPHSLEWLESKGEGVKLGPRWIGPFEVLEKVNENVYRLSLPDNYPGSPVMNIAHLKKYNEPEDSEHRNLFPTNERRKEASQEYEVERILGHKYEGQDNKLKFLIRWKGYGPQFDLWEEASSLRNAPRILREYRKKAGV